MTARSWTRTQLRRATIAVVAVGATALPGGPAAAADPPAPVPLLPGVEDIWEAQLASDAIYALDNPSGADPAIYRRALTTTPGGVTLGPPEYVARGAEDGRLTVHDGTLAYARAIDGHLVLRAPDGTETLPAWDASVHGFIRGIGDLTADWVVGDTLGSWPHLYDLQTGAELDVAALTPDQGTDAWAVDRIEVSDSRLLWWVRGHATPPDPLVFGVYTVALGPDGPTGPVVTLEQNSCTALPCTGLEVWPVDVVGDTVVWAEQTTDTVLTVRALTGPPYDAAPIEVLTADGWVTLPTPTTIAVNRDGIAGDRIRWYDLTSPDPATAVASLDLAGWGWVVGDTLVAYQPSPDGPTQLVDGAGRTITATGATPAPPSFSDVPRSEMTNSAFYGEIMWLADRGIVGGYADGTFRGLASVNRDAMAAFLYRAAHDGADAPACTTAPFPDVPVTHPFCGEIAWLAGTGITTGWPDGTFRPGTPVTREAMAAFLYRFAHDGADAPACTEAPFTDVATTHPFCGEIAWTADAGISRGWADGTFRPGLLIERQAMAAFLFRFIDAGLVPAGE